MKSQSMIALVVLIAGLHTVTGCELRLVEEPQLGPATGVRDYKLASQSRPIGWPEDQAWKPRANVGPHFRGSEFKEIEVVLNPHLNRLSWYFSNYFTELGAIDLAIYQKYWQTQWFPSVSSPVKKALAIPGAPPTGAPGSSVLFYLDSIDYSSRYGGSVELYFRQDESTAFEIAKMITAPADWRIWDISGLNMFIYVTPQPNVLNPSSPRWANARLAFVEFTMVDKGSDRVSDQVQVYEYTSTTGVPNNVNDLERNLEVNQTYLSDVLKELGAAVTPPLGAPPTNSNTQAAVSLAYGWIHSQKKDEIGDDGIVTGIKIGDQELQIYADNRHFTIEARLENIQLDPTFTSPINGRMNVYHKLTGDDWVYYTTHNFSLPNNSSTDYVQLARKLIRHCGSFKGIKVEITAAGIAAGSETFEREHLFQPDTRSCSAAANDPLPLSCNTVRDCSNPPDPAWGQVGQALVEPVHLDALDESDIVDFNYSAVLSISED